MKQNSQSFIFAMVALACSVGVSCYALYLANSLMARNRELEARVQTEAEGGRRRDFNLRQSEEMERLEAERRILARVELDRQQRATAEAESAVAAALQADFAKIKGKPVELEREIAPGVKMAFRLIPPGTFQMGSPNDDPFRNENEILHTVEITQGFYMAKFEITQDQWKAVMGVNPSHSNSEKLMEDTGNLPVDQVSVVDVLEFCAKVQKNAGLKLRLPTEAQWEYACRAGTSTPSYKGPVMRDSQGMFVDGNHKPVGSYPPNAFGLYDMMGNVWEWCSDWFAEYPKSTLKDPTGPDQGIYRILRGGPWNDNWSPRRSAYRLKLPENTRWNRHGARLVLPVEAAMAKP